MDDEEYMIADGDTKRDMCEFRIISTKWRERSFDLIECDFKSRSLRG